MKDIVYLPTRGKESVRSITNLFDDFEWAMPFVVKFSRGRLNLDPLAVKDHGARRNGRWRLSKDHFMMWLARVRAVEDSLVSSFFLLANSSA